MVSALPERTLTVPAVTRPIALLVQPSSPTIQSVDAVFAAHGFEIHITEDPATELSTAALMLIEADRGGRTLALVKQAHAQRPDLPIAGVLNWWNDDERLFEGVADLIVHAPMRHDQIVALERFAATVAHH